MVKGLAIAKRLKAFEVGSILYNNRNRSEEGDSLNFEFVGFDELLQRSDYVICSCAATPQTAKIFNKSSFGKMKKSAIFVNVSRGVVVDQEDLYEALSNKVIHAAGKFGILAIFGVLF